MSSDVHSRWALRLVVSLLYGLGNLAFAQAKTSQEAAPPQSDTGTPVFRAQSKLVVVRVMVADKKAWRNGPSKAGKRCALATEETFFRLPATEPYIPTDCEELYIRDLSTRDFHVLVDGVPERIQSVTSETDRVRVRDNQGFHNEFSQTPAGKWSTRDYPIPHYIQPAYGLELHNRYDLSFVPGSPQSTGCHKIKVNVDRHNSIVAARDDYCDNESPTDILNGSTFGSQLERDLTSGQSGDIPLALQTATFNGEKGRGRLRIALEFPRDPLDRHWSQDWKLDATIGLVGIIYRPDASPTARFSDFACCTRYSNASVWGTRGMSISRFSDLGAQFGVPSGLTTAILKSTEKAVLPTHYETHLDLPPGEYDLRIVLSDGKKFGRAETHLKVENREKEVLALSSIMLCKRFRDAHVAAVETAAANFAPQYAPMVSNGIQVTPTGDTDFKAGEPLIPYFEIYTPKADGNPKTQIQVHMRIVDAKNGETVKDFPTIDAGPYVQADSKIIPVAREVPIAGLPKGQYRLEVQATDSAGKSTSWQTAKFNIEGEK